MPKPAPTPPGGLTPTNYFHPFFLRKLNLFHSTYKKKKKKKKTPPHTNNQICARATMKLTVTKVVDRRREYVYECQCSAHPFISHTLSTRLSLSLAVALRFALSLSLSLSLSLLLCCDVMIACVAQPFQFYFIG